MIEYCWVNLSHDHKKESEEDDITPPLLHTRSTPQLGNQSGILLQNTCCYLFDYILTPTLCDTQCDRLLLKVGKIVNLYPQVEEGIFEGVIR